MRIHTNTIRASQDIFDARHGTLWIATQELNPVVWLPTDVTPLLKVSSSIDWHGSRTHKRAFELTLRGTSTRRPNNRQWEDEYAATWDERGVMLARIFKMDPNARCGTAKNPTYINAEHYHWATGNRFRSLEMPGDTHQQHRWEYQGESATGSYGVYHCRINACSALIRRANLGSALWAA